MLLLRPHRRPRWRVEVWTGPFWSSGRCPRRGGGDREWPLCRLQCHPRLEPPSPPRPRLPEQLGRGEGHGRRCDEERDHSFRWSRWILWWWGLWGGVGGRWAVSEAWEPRGHPCSRWENRRRMFRHILSCSRIWLQEHATRTVLQQPSRGHLLLQHFRLR